MAANAIQLAQQDGTDLASGSNVRSAASAAVQVLDRNDANLALAVGRFAQPEIFRGMLETDGHRPILKDNLVGAALGLAKLLRFQRAGDIDRACFRAQMKTDGGGVEHFNQYGRQQMLTGVLLHVIEAAA